MKSTSLNQEWQTLQQSHEQYEKNALVIKLVCMALCVIGIGLRVPLVWLACCVLLLWAQEAIFKTYQSRIVDRLLRVELLMAQSTLEQSAMQLHTEWVARRPGLIGLLSNYAISACKPTVAFPYLPMLVLGLWIDP